MAKKIDSSANLTADTPKSGNVMQHAKSVLALVSIVAVMGLLLAVTNFVTAPIIQENQSAAGNAALQSAIEGSAGFEEIDLSQYELPATVTAAYRETSGKGYVIVLSTTGYKPGMNITCGVSPEGVILSAECTESSETNGAETTYGANFVGKDAAGVEGVDTVSGSTKTTAAYKAAMTDAINAATILGGGSVDLRGEEEILADNLKAALPAGDTFTKWFATEVTEGVDAIYVADNGAGYVCVIGEEFIGVGADGQSDNQAAAAAVKALQASKPTDVKIEGTGINENIQKVQKTSTGNYVIEINGLGYAWFDDNHGYGEQRFVPIVIRVSLTADGTIIDCLTVSHEESKNIGDVCGTEAYYSQFDGKTADTYAEVDAINGATMTTNGYMKAIERCFEAVEILEGGAK